MIIITEDQARELVTPADAFTAVADVFRGMARGDARNFPVVREKLPEVGGTFGVKSAVDLTAGIVGLKTGGYWGGNSSKGLKNHQSTTLVCDATTGQARAVVAANYLTAIRTAAASAVATDTLARQDVKTLAVIGAGAQALPQIEAQCAVRQFEHLFIAARNPEKAEHITNAVRKFVASCSIVTIEEAVRNADVIVTVTPSTSPVIKAEWVRGGTHINAVGSDTRGKQELETELVLKARMFVDEWEQSIRIGECQGAFEGGMLKPENVAAIGAILEKTAIGRSNVDEITIFDSTGVALQDLAVARMALVRSGA